MNKLKIPLAALALLIAIGSGAMYLKSRDDQAEMARAFAQHAAISTKYQQQARERALQMAEESYQSSLAFAKIHYDLDMNKPRADRIAVEQLYETRLARIRLERDDAIKAAKEKYP